MDLGVENRAKIDQISIEELVGVMKSIGAHKSTVELHNSRLHNSRKLQNSRRFGGDQGFLFNKNP